jgi:hypothetical protein
MILLYTFLVFFLVAVKVLTDRRVAGLERKYAKTAGKVDQLWRVPVFKEGSNTRLDPCLMAKRQYQLGLLVQKRDQLEGKHEAWQARADRVARWLRRVRGWKGKKLPYTFGVVDVSLLLYLIDQLGVAQYVGMRHLAQQVVALISR